MAINPQQFTGVLLHTIGLMTFGGGQIWIQILMVKLDKSQNPSTTRFFIKMFPMIFKTMSWGLLVLFFGGVIRLVALNEPDFLGLPKTWGWVMLTKILLYIVVGINSILITERLVPAVIETASETVEEKSTEVFLRALNNLKRILKMNLLLTFAIGILGVTAQAI